jgi:hypothetical protein
VLSVQRSAAKALKLAKAADKRSRQALSAASKPGPRGPEGPQGPAGPGGGGAGSAAVTAVDFREDAPVSNRVIYNRGGLVLTASCTAGPNLDVRATTSVDHSVLHVALVFHKTTTTETAYLQKNDFLTTGVPQSITNVTESPTVFSNGGHLQGSLTFSTPSGTVTTLTYAAEQGAFGGAAAKGCWFGGMAETNG